MRPERLLAYFPFDKDFQDYSPKGTAIAKDHYLTNNNVTLSKHIRADHSEGLVAYFNGESFIEINIDINSNIHPEITMGAWVFMPEYKEKHSRSNALIFDTPRY